MRLCKGPGSKRRYQGREPEPRSWLESGLWTVLNTKRGSFDLVPEREEVFEEGMGWVVTICIYDMRVNLAVRILLACLSHTDVLLSDYRSASCYKSSRMLGDTMNTPLCDIPRS